MTRLTNRTMVGLVCLALVASLVPGCWETGGGVPAKKPATVTVPIKLPPHFNMGAGVMHVLLNHVGSCEREIVRVNQAQIMAAVNHVFPSLSQPGFRNQLRGSIEKLFPIIDNQTLPQAVGSLRGLMNMLVADREVMEAIVKVSQGPSPLDSAITLRLVGQVLNYPELEELMYAVAKLLSADDGRMLRGLLALVSTLLIEFGDLTEDEQASKDARRQMVDELLRELDGVQAGPATPIARLDESGRPITAAIEREEPYPGYTDDTGAGADDGEGKGPKGDPQPDKGKDSEKGHKGGGFLGGLLDEIDVPDELSKKANEEADKGLDKLGKLFGGGKSYADRIGEREIARKDPRKRVVRLEPTIRMEKTVLAALLRSVGEGVRSGLHCDLVTFLSHALGGRQGGGFSPTNPIAEMQFGQLELMKYRQAPKLLDALAMTLETDPELAEALLAKVLRLVSILRKVETKKGPTKTPEEEDALLHANLKLLDQMFKRDAKGTSAGRALVDVITRLGQVARDVPREFASMFYYRSMVRGDNGDGNLIDEAASSPVDRSMPAYYKDASGKTVDNRSCFERLAALVRTTSRCHIPVLNKSLALLHHELLAELTPDSAILIHDLMVKAVSFDPKIGNLVCKDIAAHIDALTQLTNSGALDALIPVMKMFKQRGQLQLFLDLLLLTDEHYDQMRPQEETVIQVLKSGAIEVVFDLLSLANTIKIPGTQNEVVADVLADFIASLLDHSKPARDIRGEERPAKIYLLLDPMKRLNKALAGTPGEAALDRLITKAIDVFLGVKHHDGGTPNNPDDDFDTIENKFVVPLLARALSVAASKLPKNPSDRVKKLEQDQQDMMALWQKKAVGDLVEFLQFYCANPERGLFDRVLVYILTPHDNPDQNLFGTVLMIAGTMMQTPADGKSLGKIARFAGKALDPDRGHVQPLVAGLVGIVRVDDSKCLMGCMRRAFSMNVPGMGGEMPIQLFMRLLESAKLRCGPKDGALTLERLIQKIQDFARALQHLDVMFSLVLNRQGGPGGPRMRMEFDPESYEGAVQRKDKRRMFELSPSLAIASQES